MATYTILVVDDDHEVVRLMKAYLVSAGYLVRVAYDGETALHMIRAEHPDLVLLDLLLPDRSGLEIIRIIRSDVHLSELPILLLTAKIEDSDKILGLELGADDYITKPYNPREVIARIRSRLRIQDGLSQVAQERVLRYGPLVMDIAKREVTVSDQQVSLTSTEFELLRVLMSQAEFVLTRNELARRSIGDEYMVLSRTLDSHIRNLRAKIDLSSKNQSWIQTIYGVGYRLVNPERES
jgi:two-component system alkaline phosphatase synthesis response regulator PhoP